ncbi:MAG: DUF58 domain-containing protein [Bacteroidetes bacterium]|nr:DUF58 domain-containing protein [Bacteroidota bacterium]
MLLHPQYIQKYSALELLARQVVEGFITGLHKSPFHGFSVEFAEHRLYNPGESTKHIDWKLYGRSDKLFVKRYEEETNLRCQLVLDASSSMYYPVEAGKKPEEQHHKLNFSIQSVAALAELLLRQRDAVGLSVFANTLQFHAPARATPAQKKMLFHELEKLQQQYNPQQKTTTLAGSLLDQIADITHKRSLIIIFSDMFEDGEKEEKLFSALQHLKHKKHEVLLFHVHDKKSELDFDFENRPHHFIDMENGEEIKLNPQQAKEHYVQHMTAYLQQLKNKCGQYKIDFIAADIAEGFDKVLSSYLIKRAAML